MPTETSNGAQQLRARALARFNSQAVAHLQPESPTQTRSLVHELQVHQIELELQNEELRLAQVSMQADLLRYVDLYDWAPCGLLRLDAEGVIAQANLMGAKLLGLERNGLTGLTLAALVAQPDEPHVTKLIADASAGLRGHAIDAALRADKPMQRTLRLEASLSPDGKGCCVAMMDVTDRRQFEQARDRAANLELERQAALARSRAKSAFMSCMSHELRTPLNAILGFAQLLKIDQRHALDEQQSRRVQAVLVAGGHLLKLIDDVLDLAHMEEGTVRLDHVPVNTRQVLDSALCVVAPALEDSGLTLTVDYLPADKSEGVVLVTDKGRLMQVLVNLLTNAIIYNVPDGTVHVTMDMTQEQAVRITVADTGCGMNEIQLVKAFESFNRLGQERGDIPGIGIGLAITRWLVEMMGGTLEIQSSVGQGSRFDVLLPYGQRAPMKRAASNDPSRPGILNVLYIEHNPLNADLMADVVAMRPACQVHVAGSVSDGVALAARVRPGLVMLDLNLPDCKGLAAFHRLRNADGMQDAKFVVVSADATPSQVEAVLAAGADAYMAKPINVADVLSLLARSA